ncbi:hypothetical protein [Haloarcula marismortui]|uniref:Uncharacterized protein n=1 Tax=Haloarcula marismortui (strain ATCC 43049 / DSM 3752 / JCM 8966 / VKM B-1809) TaxID=272569 RepID=A0A4P8K0C0_HALMA|nr:hypothetical protein [Haloarcula marismortui]QCP92898.1 hypothetical protein E6P14_19280 [Haloarcula marismortui ATCC 43049]
MTDAPTISGDGGVLLPSSAVGARWDTDGRDTSRTLAAGVPAALQSLARHDDGMAHPSSGVSTPPASLCWCDRWAGRVVYVRAGWRVYVTDDTSVGTMDGELTSANH